MIVLAAKRWHKRWANKHIVIHSDNKTAVNIINKGSTPDQTIMTELRQLFWLSALFNFRITVQYIKGKHNTVADAISRLHEAPCHVHILDSVLLRFFLPQTHRDTYFRFCAYMGYAPVPVEPEHLCQYVAFLARSLKVSSIQQYINIVGLLHKQLGLPNPLLNNWPLKSFITSIKRALGEPPNQKLPITPSLLMQIFDKLNMLSSFDALFWAVCQVAFFGMFCKVHTRPLIWPNN